MKYRIVKKSPIHFEVQYLDWSLWNYEKWTTVGLPYSTLDMAMIHVERQQAYRAQGEVVWKGEA